MLWWEEEKLRWKTTDRQRRRKEEHMENGFAAQCAGIQGNNYSTAFSIVCLGKPNPAKANFNSSLLKLLSASWLAESQEGQTDMGNGSAWGEETERDRRHDA